MVADVRRADRLPTRKLVENKNPDAGFLFCQCRKGPASAGGDKEALQAGPVVENCSGTERFRVSASRAQGTAIRIAAFGERRRKHVPLGVVSATAAAFGVEGAPIPSRAPLLYCSAARWPLREASEASLAKSRVNRIFGLLLDWGTVKRMSRDGPDALWLHRSGARITVGMGRSGFDRRSRPGSGKRYRQLHRRPHAAPDIEKLQKAQLLAGRC